MKPASALGIAGPHALAMTGADDDLSRRMQSAHLRKMKALLDYEQAVRDLIEIEAEREFLQSCSRKH